MKAKKIKNRLPRLPKVLTDELLSALSITDAIGHEYAMELLARYRRDRVKRIAVWGISNVGAKVDGLELEPIPFEHFRKIEQLDMAFQKIHEYRNGGAGDYVAADVERAINSLRARQPRTRSTEYDEIGEYLRRRGYVTSDNKKAIVLDAISHFQVSESMIRRAISASGLSGKKTTST